METILLIGMMGSGKTSVGKLLAEHLKCDHLDTDHLIETSQNLSITQIFEMFGEAKFRELEKNSIEAIANQTNIVVSTGGGIILNPLNTKRLREMGTVIYLKGSVDQLKRNLSNATSNRPLLKTQDLAMILKKRSDLYEQAAHFSVCINDRSIESIVFEILKRQGL